MNQKKLPVTDYISEIFHISDYIIQNSSEHSGNLDKGFGAVRCRVCMETSEKDLHLGLGIRSVILTTKTVVEAASSQPCPSTIYARNCSSSYVERFEKDWEAYCRVIHV
jgi:hypothetical protein